MDLNNLKGIGEKTEKLFYKAGVEKVNDLLRYYPRYYDVFEEPVLIRDLECDRTQAIKGTVVREVSVKRVRNLQVVTGYLRDERGDAIKATWFNSPYLKGKLTIGSTFIFRGFVKENYSNFSIEQPKIFGIAEYNKKKGEMQPVYPLVSGLTNNMVQKAVKQALKLVETEEFLPEKIRNKYGLEGLQQAIEHIHYPTDKNQLYSARKRLIFDEFFMFIYNIRNLKDKNTEIHNRHILEEPKEVKTLINNLPYELTNAQKRTWEEIKRDISSTKVMNRLIQGDVGSGKTIIAFFALITAALNNGQGAMMAPTEVLARQHYDNLIELIKEHNINVNPVVLVGSMTAKEKREAYKVIESGDADIIIGTHALIQEKVNYNNLTMVVTDEQHRFGVRQREAISEKGEHPHIMVMSATPIPRTLAIIMYGDLDISVIDELPANRLPIANCVVGTDYRPNAYDFMTKQIAKGRQVYVICPTVEYSEAVEGENVIEYAEKLKRIMPVSVNIEFLHGRMKPAEKNEIMDRFANNQIQILVSTTVVEVGVNVPNATVMMVENAERFGLAQLHQLRGRVGRGKYQSYCIFINGSGKKEALERLNILCKSNDGFLIANEDLKLRGPGDFFGVRQSGDFEFRLGDIMNDANILKQASEAVELILNEEVEISDKQRKIIIEYENDSINI
ncbi:MAG: ATP-dependent DNA helicase RecG [Eubacterium ventriosum]|jgi:ATP-dependent DNA helicase recG|uniref:ATP-dependent DNA helicase RecG n=1 Tax=Eubacterium ventriosum TaxID=39496 RepID=UPI001C00B2D8|nr:ATP-dependent DNA helicase RecG [Eubacterium ventriosum]MBS5018111.1 ATP-dependent DNA helicase RecG [Eubacterium ventriosum]MBT9698475.1 ATP-dependent DNA helicase RecG [Eubacterium ventriosum]